jgi:hypothetical protein
MYEIGSIVEKELFLRSRDNPRSTQMWRAYISFLENCPYLETWTPNSVVHHILWRAEYPQFVKSKWNLIRLSHDDHTAAAALMLGAEPKNRGLLDGFKFTSKLTAGIRPSWQPKNPRRVIRLYTKERWSAARIGCKFKVGIYRVIHFLRRNKIEISSRNHGRSLLFRFSKKEIKQMIRMYLRELKTSVVIGKKFGLSSSGVMSILRRNNVPIRDLSISHQSHQWFAQQTKTAIRLYTKKFWGTERIGRYLNIPEGCVAGHLIRNGIRIRTQSEASKLIKIRVRKEKSNPGRRQLRAA